jgi:parvulin-like peptidyl-prolyl isomerase
MSAVDKKSLRHEMYRKKIPRSYIAIFVLLVFLFTSISYAIFGFYLEHWYTGPARVAARVLPLPAVIVESKVVWYRDVSEFANVFAVAQEDQGVELGDPFQAALERTVSNKHLQNFAKELGVNLTKQDLLNYEIADPDLEEFLDRVGWKEAQYRKFIVEPLLLAQESEALVFANPEYQTESLKAIQNLEQDIGLGIRFEDLAMQYSHDVSAETGGYLGFFTKDAMPEGLDDLFDAEIGEPSEIIETEHSFVIAQVYDVLGFGEDRLSVAIQIITIKKTGLSDALDDFAETQSVRYFVR